MICSVHHVIHTNIDYCSVEFIFAQHWNSMVVQLICVNTGKMFFIYFVVRQCFLDMVQVLEYCQLIGWSNDRFNCFTVLTQVLSENSSSVTNFLNASKWLAKLSVLRFHSFCVDIVSFLFRRDGFFLPHESIISFSSGTMSCFSLFSCFIFSAVILFAWQSLFWSSLMLVSFSWVRALNNFQHFDFIRFHYVFSSQHFVFCL